MASAFPNPADAWATTWAIILDLCADVMLWGAAGLTRRWRPVLATEPRLEALAPRLFREHLVPLGYRLSGSCEGLSFYTASNASHPVLRAR